MLREMTFLGSEMQITTLTVWFSGQLSLLQHANKNQLVAWPSAAPSGNCVIQCQASRISISDVLGTMVTMGVGLSLPWMATLRHFYAHFHPIRPRQ